MAEKQNVQSYDKGDKVRFIGYAEETPEEQQLLVVDTVYEVVEVADDDQAIIVEIENPDFNARKKESDSNPKTLRVDVFFDEVELVEDDNAAEEAATQRRSTRAAGKQQTTAAPAAAAKAKAGSKTSAPAAATTTSGKATTSKATTGKAAAGKAATGKAAAGKGAVAQKGKGATKPAQKENTEPEDKYPALDAEDQEIVELIENHENLVELAQELSEDSAALDYKLGGVLYHVRLDKAYQALDPRYAENDGFGLFVRETLNIEYRKAMYLVDIYYKFNKYGIDPEKVAELGWTKCSRIAAVMSSDNAEELLELAKENTLSDLSDTIKESFSRVSTGATEVRRKIAFKFRLWEDQAVGVRTILEGVTEKMGFKDPADAFEHIVVEWAAEHFTPAPAGKATSRASGTARATKRTTA